MNNEKLMEINILKVLKTFVLMFLVEYRLNGHFGFVCMRVVYYFCNISNTSLLSILL